MELTKRSRPIKQLTQLTTTPGEFDNTQALRSRRQRLYGRRFIKDAEKCANK